MKRTGLLSRVLPVLCGAVLCTASPAGEVLWKPIQDSVYLQEVGRQVATDSPILALAVYNGRLYAGLDEGLYVLKDGALIPVEFPKERVQCLAVLNDALWIITGAGLYRMTNDGHTAIAQGRFTALCGHLDTVVVATGRGLLRVEGDTLVPIPGADRAPGAIQSIASYGETIYCLTPGRLLLFDGNRYDDINTIDWGELPSKDTRGMMALGSRLYIATGGGLGVLRGMGMTAIRGQDGLCYEDTTCLASGFAGDVWVGTSNGAIRMVEGAFHYFNMRRWLPHDNVRAIACGENVAYIGTDTGLGIIEYEPYTLRKKAAYYERYLEEWGMKRLGFVHKLEWDESQGWIREVSDNDAGWSTHFLTAMCFKYAVTGEKQAREEALNYFNSLKWTEEITPIPGFPARSIWAKGEKGHQAEGGSGGFAAEWHDTDDGVWQWKADTSSDETDAHFYAASIFHDLVAQGDEKRRALEHMDRIASHIIREGWVLRDLDGKPTVWARWDPEYFTSLRGSYARGLNGLEILSYMRTAATLTGDAKFEDAYKQLQEFGYPNYVLRQKLVFPPDNVFHSDDRLAFYVYYPLLKYETDPKLRSIYRRSLERSWEIERIEHNPWFAFIYGALTGNDCETAQAVKHLREWPLDLRQHDWRSSHRDDLFTPGGYVAYAGGARGLSPRVTGPIRWSNTTLQYDGGAGGRVVVDPSGWLDAYWMGRYYGFITAPATDDLELTTVEQRGLQLGAEPYKGPPRPPGRR
ncbi:MAG: hypothetical protein GWP08_05685 [Nitrospiraceae bacterium]|nr:hypothetical protein [Nitrospiraceae bacterium]